MSGLGDVLSSSSSSTSDARQTTVSPTLDLSSNDQGIGGLGASGSKSGLGVNQYVFGGDVGSGKKSAVNLYTSDMGAIKSGTEIALASLDANLQLTHDTLSALDTALTRGAGSSAANVESIASAENKLPFYLVIGAVTIAAVILLKR